MRILVDVTPAQLNALNTIAGITVEIAERAVRLRRTMRLKLPDAIIEATALTSGRTLVTHNTRDFPADGEAILIPC
jgi:predicted nucleic acid-binding protein